MPSPLCHIRDSFVPSVAYAVRCVIYIVSRLPSECGVVYSVPALGMISENVGHDLVGKRGGIRRESGA